MRYYCRIFHIIGVLDLLADGKKCSSGLQENLLANVSPGIVILYSTFLGSWPRVDEYQADNCEKCKYDRTARNSPWLVFRW